MADIRKDIKDVFDSLAEGLETGSFGEKIKIGLTTLGSEHSIENLVKAAEKVTKNNDFSVVLIGPKVETSLEVIEINDENSVHKKMEELLDSGYIKGCVTMHYSFPIGVSTVGRVITPSKGQEMFIATTTGTSDTNRTVAMIKNAIYGIITAKSLGIEEPTVGILNVDNARAVERALNKLNDNGYKIKFSTSKRSDGGVIMRGNDLLMASCDVMVTDTLTGNILMKLFSSFTTGGSYESLGYGYGPGIGEDFERLVLILSRASGIPVIENALLYGYQLAKNKVLDVKNEEFKKVNSAKYKEIIAEFKEDKKDEASENIKAPQKEVVTFSISGIDIMDLETAVTELWKEDIYAESGMGCTGPIVLVNEKNGKKAIEILSKKEFIANVKIDC